jgi:hypothetical protein
MAMPTPTGELFPRGREIDKRRLREDRALFERFADRGDPVDREILVERFLPLAHSLAARYVRPNEPFDDIFQVACLGLVKAIDRFDLSRDRAFLFLRGPHHRRGDQALLPRQDVGRPRSARSAGSGPGRRSRRPRTRGPVSSRAHHR